MRRAAAGPPDRAPPPARAGRHVPGWARLHIHGARPILRFDDAGSCLSSLHHESTLAHLAPTTPPGAASEHVVHFYDEDASLVRVVTSFLGEGLAEGDAALIVATGPHLRAIEGELEARGFDCARARAEGRLAALPADEALGGFMRGEVAEGPRFHALFEGLAERLRARSSTGRVRAYGEMVELLWRRGHRAATVRVEELWSELVRRGGISLLCAYRLDGFASREHAATFARLCATHAAVLPSDEYAFLTHDEKLRRVAELERRARSLEEEVALRRRVEAERAHLYEAERRARAEATILYQLTDAASRAETLEQVYDVALEGIASALGVDRASILLFDADGVMRFTAWRGLSDGYRAAVEGHSPWSPEDTDPAPVLVADVRTDAPLAALWPALQREGIGALGFFPLRSGGRLLGKFMVYYPGPHEVTPAERRLAMAIADQIAFAVDRRLALLERERFLGIVGHDLRNPLSAISLSATTLLRLGGDARLAVPVRRILSSAQRMQRLIDQLLELAQARHGTGIPVHSRPCDLGEILRHVLDELQAAHPEGRFDLAVDGDPHGRWDPDRLGEVFSNLVGNAVQHGEGQAVTVRVRGAGDEVTTDIHNHGSPIPDTLLPRLFEPFRRGDASYASRGGHAGLGLFIAREIVRAHAGRIDLRSHEEDGTTFTVSLPRGGR